MGLKQTYTDLSKALYGNRRQAIVASIVDRAEAKTDKNRYEMIDYFVENDLTLYSGLRFFSLAVGSAYSGYNAKHEGIQKKAISLAFNLMKYGDVYIEKKTQKMLPSFGVTIVDDAKRVGNFTNTKNVYITDKKVYVLNEKDQQTRKTYKADDIIHLSLNSEGTRMKDIYGRETYSIYSVPPTQPLLKQLKWKELLVDNDVMWRDKMVPREHHKVKIDVDIDEFTGTLQEKIKKAQDAAAEYMTDYVSSIGCIESGQSYVTSDNVDIDIIETQLNYSSPNQMLSDIDKTIAAGLNVPVSAVCGESGSNYSSELIIATYFMMNADSIIEIINEYFLYKYPGADLSKAKVMLEMWKTEVFKRASLATGLGVFTTNEIRQMLGYDNITEDKLAANRGYMTSNSSSNESPVDGRTIDGITNGSPEGDGSSPTPNRDSTRNHMGEERAEA
ncbi:hypothetical protein HNP86_001923 [Methanococcus maripaludis]|uniref:Phage portal protein n=1 Tax=Methanococcus maripaludis TaxID=39152 RepID=A0A7J9NWX7_METMI|nr:hypothetical protein [Methanococcus maripaludis]MBA2851764.1 hypothetical protein [Methanococcus maripaludis]